MVTIGVDGLIEIASRCGLVSYSTVVGPGANGWTCAVTLVLEDREVVEVYDEQNEAIMTRKGSSVWKNWPERMIRSFAINQAIRKHFKAAVEEAEEALESEVEL